MAFSQSFSVASTIDPTAIVINDTSVGSDANIASRTIVIYKADNSTFYSGTWNLGPSTTTLNILTKDLALSIVVNWLSAANAVLYTANQLYTFTGFLEQFYYSLTQNQTSSPTIVNDPVYYNDKLKLRVEIDSAVQAYQVGSDIYGSQACIDRAYNMMQNPNDYF